MLFWIRTTHAPRPGATRAWAVLVAALMTLTLAAGDDALARRRSKRRSKAAPKVAGGIDYTTAKRAYLTSGEADGLNAGQTVQLLLGRSVVGECQVDTLADHRATCALKASIEERPTGFAVKGLVPQPAEDRPVRPAQPSGFALPAKKRFAKVGYDAPPRLERAGFTTNSEIGARIQGAFSGLDAGREAARGTLYAGIYGAQVYFPGLRLFARTQLHGVFPPNTRFRKNDPVRLEVHELALAYRHQDSLFSGAVGRFRPWNAPGTPVLDGVQGAMHFFDNALEVGLYGGLIPTQLEIAPQLNDGAVGAYWSLRKAFGGFRVANQGQVGTRVRADDGIQPVATGETHVQAHLGQLFNLAGGLRVSGSPDAPNLAVNLGYVQATSAPVTGLRVRAGYRYTGQLLADSRVTALPLLEEGFHHANAGATWNQLWWFEARLDASASALLSDRALRLAISPEVGLPRLFGSHASVFVGGSEFVGNASGRHVYVRSSLSPWWGAFLSSRVYYLDTAASPDIYRATGAELFVEHSLFSQFEIWGRGRAEIALPSFRGMVAPSSGIVHGTGEVGASARF